MATILAAANGNWSATATWTGGVVPGAGDIAVANGKTITLDVATITVASLRADTTGGAANGGTFSLSLTSTTVNGDVIAGAGHGISGLNAGKTLTVNGTAYGGTGAGNTYGIVMTGGTLFLSAAQGVGGNWSSCFGVYMSAGTAQIGDCLGGGGAYAVGLYCAGGQATVSRAVGGAGTAAYGVQVEGTGNVSVTTARASALVAGLALLANGAQANVTTAEAGRTLPAVINTGSGRLGVRRLVWHGGGQCPVQGRIRLIEDGSVPAPIYLPDATDHAASAGSGPALRGGMAMPARVLAVAGEMLKVP